MLLGSVRANAVELAGRVSIEGADAHVTDSLPVSTSTPDLSG
jgi:hypothetical protein